VNFWEYQARKTNKGRRDPLPVDDPPPISQSKLEESLEPTRIEVQEQSLSDTFIRRMRADLRKLWSKE
jgi:hypothetical protein